MDEDRELKNYFVVHWLGGKKEVRKQLLGSEQTAWEVFQDVREERGLDVLFEIVIVETKRGLSKAEEDEVFDAAFTDAVHPLAEDYWFSFFTISSVKEQEV